MNAQVWSDLTAVGSALGWYFSVHFLQTVYPSDGSISASIRAGQFGVYDDIGFLLYNLCDVMLAVYFGIGYCGIRSESLCCVPDAVLYSFTLCLMSLGVSSVRMGGE